jgi:hypothetical protein
MPMSARQYTCTLMPLFALLAASSIATGCAIFGGE